MKTKKEKKEELMTILARAGYGYSTRLERVISDLITDHEDVAVLLVHTLIAIAEHKRQMAIAECVRKLEKLGWKPPP